MHVPGIGVVSFLGIVKKKKNRRSVESILFFLSFSPLTRYSKFSHRVRNCDCRTQLCVRWGRLIHLLMVVTDNVKPEVINFRGVNGLNETYPYQQLY